MNDKLSPDQMSAMTTSAPQDTLSKDQLDAMMGTSLKPDQSAAVLGHSNNMLLNGLKTGWQGLTSLSQGAAKGAIQGIDQGLGGLAAVGGGIESGLDKLTGSHTAPGAFQGARDLNAAAQIPALQAKNNTEKVGAVIGQVADALVTPPGGKGAALATDVTKDAVTGTAKTLASMSEKRATAKITQLVSPRLTAKVAETAEKTNPKGIMGKIGIKVSDRTKQVATAVKGIVNPRKTFTENANSVSSAIETEAKSLVENLKEATLKTPVKVLQQNVAELSAKLKDMDKPILVSTDAALNMAFDKAIGAASKILEQQGGTGEGMLEARKTFDALAREQFPNVFNDDAKMGALSEGIKKARQVINDFIGEKFPDAKVTASLEKQSLMYDAFDNLSEKAARGAPKSVGEVGTTRFSRFAQNHPNVVKGTKWGTGIVGTALVGGAAFKEGENLLP